MSDIGLTHIALPVRHVADSVRFYARFAGMQVIHDRRDDTTGHHVVWLCDGTRPFIIVLIEQETVEPLKPIAHLGVGLPSRQRLDALVAEARVAGVPVTGPEDYGPPVGYWAFLADPDGHTLELSHGQDIAFAIDHALGAPGAATDKKRPLGETS